MTGEIQIPEAVTQGVQRVVEQQGEGLLSQLVNAPFRFIGSFFSGALGNGLWLAPALFGLSSWKPEWIDAASERLTSWLGTQSWASSWLPNIRTFLHDLAHGNNGQRITNALLLGGGLGGVIGGVGGVFSGGQTPQTQAPQQSSGFDLGSILMWGAVAAVGVGAVHYITSHGDSSGPESAPPPQQPRTPTLDQGVTQPH